MAGQKICQSFSLPTARAKSRVFVLKVWYGSSAL